MAIVFNKNTLENILTFTSANTHTIYNVASYIQLTFLHQHLDLRSVIYYLKNRRRIFKRFFLVEFY